MPDMTSATAAFFVGPECVEIRPVGVPDTPEPGQVAVTSELMGISHGTEMLVYTGHLPLDEALDPCLSALSGPMAYPLKYGYINVGQTDGGQRVFAFYPHQTRFHIPTDEVVPLPDDLPADDAVFLASVETALSICHDAAPVVGDAILVVGQGMIGLLVVEILSTLQPAKLVTMDPLPHRRELSSRLGCISVDHRDLGADLLSLTDGRGFDVAINTSASSRGAQTAIDSLGFGGRLVEASWYGDRQVSLGLGGAFHRKRLSIVSSQVSTVAPSLSPRWTKDRRMAEALRLVRKIKPGRYITHRFPLSKAAEAYALIKDHPDETIQVVLDPSG